MKKNNITCKRTAFIVNTRRLVVRNLTQTLPRIVSHRGWPKQILNHATKKFRKWHKIWLQKKYKMAMDSRHRKQLELKILAETLFKDKKWNYGQCSSHFSFQGERLNITEKSLRATFMHTVPKEKYVYGSRVVKFDRKGYKKRSRLLILTTKTLYLNQVVKNKLKTVDKIPLIYVNKFEVTSGKDNFLLIKISSQYKQTKGDLILEIPYLIEFITKFINISKKCTLLNINRIDIGQKLTHTIKGSKSGVIELKENKSATPIIMKDKNKNLIVSG
ncbi:unconventional myosin IC-like isoform X2 [Adelges cooleyi]|uniref:unconventional myosin IC-like isoform X2 n=1 Tax=Adelges cooleyi TaxID=133065 RepID=UPI00218097B5|nr:unconventional myosin IC-like isoform X2 [Adelges cooleyi]